MVSDEAKVADSAVIYPYAYIERGAVIGDHVVVYPYVHIGENAVVGEHSVLQPHVTLYHGVQLGKRVTVHAGAVIGSDGFGYANDGEEVLKIPQLGTVVIEDDVEIGSLANIDRGTIAATRIGEKTKIDSKVHIGHNVQIGKGCMLAAFTGIAGSSHVGDRVLTGGHSGIVGHVKVASGTILSAMSLISNDISKGEYLSGFPAIPSMKWKRSRIAEKKLPATNRQVQELSRKVIELEDKLASFLKKT